MSIVRRVAPIQANHVTIGWWHAQLDWMRQCLQDMWAGRHAVLCGCICWGAGTDNAPNGVCPNACAKIVRCALELTDYEVEVGDGT